MRLYGVRLGLGFIVQKNHMRGDNRICQGFQRGEFFRDVLMDGSGERHVTGA